MRFGSVCSGIEAASVAWHPLGWRASFLSEIEAFPRSVLAHHYPETPLHGDFTTIQAGQYEPIDLLVGGTPCQSFSVAGLRGGLEDGRGNLALEYLRLADRLRPRWLVWENVPGVLSSNGGRDFGSILGGMGELGYGVAYRVLDAQFLGVAQRRRRVFVVGYLGDWRRAAAVLFERHSLSGHPAPRREAGKAAPTIPSRSSAGGGLGTDFDCDGGLIASTGETSHCLNAGGMGRQDYETETLIAHVPDVSATLVGRSSRGGGQINSPGHNADECLIAHTLKGEGFDASEDGTGRGTPLVPVCIPINADALRGEGTALTPSADATGRVRLRDPGFGVGNDGDPAGTLAASGPGAIAFSIMPMNSGKDFKGRETDVAQPIMAAGPAGGNQGGDYIVQSAVRRLTPRECERLQGFPEVTNELRVIVCRNEAEKRALVSSVERGSAALLPGPSAPVAASVLIDLERLVLRIHSLGKSPWSVTIAEIENSSRLHIQVGDFARLAALTNSAVARSTRIGRAASPQSISPSSRPLNGSRSVVLSGLGTVASVNDAERFTADLNECSKSITSQHGPSDPICDSTWETLASCVASAMTGFIPEAMRNDCSFEISFATHHGYTAIPYRRGMAADGPRYKALGNSMAVPVMRWIGERIAAVEAMTSTEAANDDPSAPPAQEAAA